MACDAPPSIETRASFPLFLRVVHPPAVGGAYGVKIGAAIRKPLEIAARRIDAPQIVVAGASVKIKMKNNIAAVSAGCRIAVRFPLFSCDHGFAARLWIDSI